MNYPPGCGALRHGVFLPLLAEFSTPQVRIHVTLTRVKSAASRSSLTVHPQAMCRPLNAAGGRERVAAAERTWRCNMKTQCYMKTLRFAALAVFAAFAMLFCPGTARSQSTTCIVSLTPGTPCPLFVGDRVVWTATATNCGASPVYQYRVASPGEAAGDDEDDWSGGSANNGDRSSKHPQFRMVRDFSPANSFSWATLHEGSYQVMVRVKDGFDAVNSTSAVVSTTVNSRVIGAHAVVTPTLNPLVALYSAPPCAHGTIHVKFRPVSSANNIPWTATNSLPCLQHQSRN